MTNLIGIDCATQPKKVGLALAELDGDRCRLVDVGLGDNDGALLERLTEWTATERRTLIALDAPLGWPRALGPVLATHVAGAPIAEQTGTLFRRDTDRFVHETLGKLPLEVGADRIARTAHAALNLLQRLRGATGQEIPLAWSPEQPDRISAIEVYPAATLLSRGLRAASYKRKDQVRERSQIVKSLAAEMELAPHGPALEANADVLDAAICILAAADFFRGHTISPENPGIAQQEGWIWFRGPGSAAAS